MSTCSFYILIRSTPLCILTSLHVKATKSFIAWCVGFYIGVYSVMTTCQPCWLGWFEKEVNKDVGLGAISDRIFSAPI